MHNDVVETAVTNLPDSRHAMNILGCADIHACMVCYYITSYIIILHYYEELLR